MELLGLGELANRRPDAQELVGANVRRLTHQFFAAVVHDVAVQAEAVLFIWSRHQVLHIAANAIFFTQHQYQQSVHMHMSSKVATLPSNANVLFADLFEHSLQLFIGERSHSRWKEGA